MSIRGKLVAAGLGVLLLGVAGCGSSMSHQAAPASSATVSTTQLIAQMKAAVRSASSTHLDGRVSSDGRSTALDLGVLRSGALAGSITQNGVPLELIGAPGKVYVKATPAFLRELRAPAGVCALMCGKYVQMSGATAGQLSGSLTMTSLTHAFLAGLPRMTRTGTGTLAGQPVVVLRGSDGSTLDVAARGTHYPLRVTSPASRHESLTFSQWNRVSAPAAPPASEVINLSQLKAATS